MREALLYEFTIVCTEIGNRCRYDMKISGPGIPAEKSSPIDERVFDLDGATYFEMVLEQIIGADEALDLYFGRCPAIYISDPCRQEIINTYVNALIHT